MRLGEYQELVCVKKVDFGIYLSTSSASEERVLLPAKQIPDGVKQGDKLKVFVYKDSNDRLIATTNEPKLTLGGLAVLTVKEVTKIGAFLDWGLEKDLFLPYKEMVRKVSAGDEILVTLYIDKSQRLCATTKGIYHMLSTDSPYKKDDMVSGRVYDFSDNFGTFIAVDDKYSAKIPVFENAAYLKLGDVIEAKVTDVKADGKLDLTMREKAYIQMDSDSEKLLELLDSYAGVLPFSEKASPEVIKRETGLSKNAFKRAVGHLYKERKIEFISSKNGNPSPEEIKTFNDIYLMPAQLDGLRNEAESILTDILNVTYGEKLKEVEIRLEASLPSEMKKEYLQLQTQIRTNQGQLQTELSTLNKRGWGYWLTEVGKGTLITIVSTLIIWNLAAAFVVCARLSGRARSRAYYELCPSRSVVFRKGRQTRL